MELILIIIYGLAMLFIFLYSLVQIQLVYHYLKKKPEASKVNEIKEWPVVTIQLPVYNEMYVVERLLDSVLKLDYPADKIEIQVLDDSTDETSEIIESHIKASDSEIAISHIRREERTGFKAGALAHGLKMAKGSYIAIFDADFMPDPSFLKRAMRSFVLDEIGMVQTRWSHVNKDYSMLTRLQAFGLDAHFTVEQTGRNHGGHFINFNGTAGVWRKECILDSGGWQSDTLTEDLDLSYRAQIRGWKFKYLEDVESPAELPAHINALKTQQYRWTKGAAECSRKNLGKVLKSDDVSFGTKINSVFHLLNSSLFIAIVIVSVLSIPILLVKHAFPEYRMLYNLAGVFLLGVFFLMIFYFVAYNQMSRQYKRNKLQFLIEFPLFLSVSMGLSLHNGLAAFEGLIGKRTPFIRTPKMNIRTRKDDWKKNAYINNKIGKLTYIELFMVVYMSIGLFISVKFNDYGLFPFLLMLMLGYGFVSILSIRHTLNVR